MVTDNFFPGCSWRDHCSSIHLLSWERGADAVQGEDTHQVCVPQACKGLPSQEGCIQVEHYSLIHFVGQSILPLKEIVVNFCFRFYFKTEVEGDMCYEEETEDSSLVPLWEGKVLVQCRLLEWGHSSLEMRSEISAIGNTCERSAACLERRYLRLEISKCDNRTQH